MPEFSDAQIMAGISAALRANDLPAVSGLMHLLALQNPHEAALLLDAINLLAPSVGGVTSREGASNE